jgi:26S proteasome regulatory subunit N8
VQSSIGASEAEEIGVEHLLRDIKDASQGTLSKRVSDKLVGLTVLAGKLKEMRVYLEKVVEGKLAYNQQIINNYQDIFNLLPNLRVEEMVRSFSVKSNDYMYVIYVSGLIRSILSLHDLINNKINAKEVEADRAKREKEEEAEKKKKEEELRKKVDEKRAAESKQ